MAYGQTNVNGGARGGEFLTGNLDFFTLVTLVPVFQTNVTVPLFADPLDDASGPGPALKARNWTSLSASRTITVVDGTGTSVTYSSNAAYLDAYKKQYNLNTLIKVFANRVNPVVVNVYSQAGTNVDGYTFAGFSNATAFGGDYAGDDIPVYTVKLVSEKSGQWFIGSQGNFTGEPADNTNTNGYLFLSELNGVAVEDLDSAVLVSTVFNTSGSSGARNTLGVRDADLRRKSDVLA